MKIRIGNGYDVHRFEETETDSGKSIILGGIEIPHTKSILAHSDGDVLIHALCDALLGSLALGDIGKHFPDSDNAYQNIASSKLLNKVYKLVTDQSYSLVNADITVVCQAPKLQAYLGQMRAEIARLLETDVANISIKATTTEGLGFAGRGEGLAVYAVVLVSSIE